MEAGDATLYVLVDCAAIVKSCGPGVIAPIIFFVYEETNGMPGLQRHDDFASDVCSDPTLADTVILS